MLFASSSCTRHLMIDLSNAVCNNETLLELMLFLTCLTRSGSSDGVLKVNNSLGKVTSKRFLIELTVSCHEVSLNELPLLITSMRRFSAPIQISAIDNIRYKSLTGEYKLLVIGLHRPLNNGKHILEHDILQQGKVLSQHINHTL